MNELPLRKRRLISISVHAGPVRIDPSHHQADSLDVAASTIGIDRSADYPAGIKDGDAIGKRQELVEVFGDQQDCGSPPPLLVQQGVDRSGRANVDAAAGMNRDDDPWPAVQLARDEEFLLVAPGEGADLRTPVRRFDVIT